ncbi:MAG TPA: TAT-variant-translocated molybdopterin oxidoreductase, partial [Polyangiaceae bacterium]|nr:TAT-variant-translocated molybdopterin oxidoreductase [Polyangiaceae bacterium]
MSSMKNFKPLYWRSLAELENTPEFCEFVEREFAAPLEHAPPNSPERRRFLELMGASLALAGVSGCWQEDKLVPLTRRPEGVTPGVPRRFATAMDLGGRAIGLHVTSYDGRPIKVDGNPNHPDSLGACFAYQQASVLEVYDPDRSRTVLRQGKPSSWAAFEAFAGPQFAALRAKGGAGLAVLSERSSSPTLAALRARLLEAFPQATWTTYEPLASDGGRGGSVLAFGAPHRTHLSIERARVIVSLDADFLAPTFPGSLANARAFARSHVPEAETMSRLYVAESGYSLTGGHADHRLAVRSELIKAVAAYLDAELSAKLNPPAAAGPAQPKPNAAVLAEPGVQKFLDAIVRDLLANVGASLLVSGDEQPAEVHALVHRLNNLLGNVGRTVRYTLETEVAPVSDVSALSTLTGALGQIDTLLILGGNPAYSAPADIPLVQGLSGVKNSIHLSLFVDETSSRCSWHLPAAHFLESWGDARAW